MEISISVLPFLRLYLEGRKWEEEEDPEHGNGRIDGEMMMGWDGMGWDGDWKI